MKKNKLNNFHNEGDNVSANTSNISSSAEQKDLMQWWNSIGEDWHTLLYRNYCILQNANTANILSSVKQKDLMQWWKSIGKDWQKLLYKNYCRLQNIEYDEENLANIDAMTVYCITNVEEVDNGAVIEIDEESSIMKNITIEGRSYIKNFTPLQKLPKLISIVFRGEQINDGILKRLTHVLSTLTNLTTLDLSRNNLSDISRLSTLTNLTKLDLSHNKLSDLSVLSTLTNLTTLDLSRNNLSDISRLSTLTNLTKLYLSNNNLSDLSALSGLSNLTLLDLSDNQIIDISALSGLTNLTVLDLRYNQIIDISVLRDLTNLITFK